MQTDLQQSNAVNESCGRVTCSSLLRSMGDHSTLNMTLARLSGGVLLTEDLLSATNTNNRFGSGVGPVKISQIFCPKRPL